jgi:predicted dehydrogenase
MKPGIDRRQFMKRSLVGAAAAPLIARTVGAGPQSGTRQVSPNDRIQIGMIGVGARAHQLMGALKAQPGVAIVGICDAYTGRVARAIERTEGQAKDYGSWRDLLADASIDAVIVATPDHWHKEHTLAALDAGKDVYVEKPMTLTIDEGPEFIAAADGTDRILQVGSNGMSSKLQQTAREIVRSGKLGRITLIRASYDRNTDSGAWLYPIPPDASEETVDWEAFLGPAPRRPFSLERFFRWRCFWDYSGGIATDLFVHLMTTIHYVMDADMADMVMASGQNFLHQETHEVPDTLNAILTYPKEGFAVSLSGTFNNSEATRSGFTIMGTEGALVFHGNELVFKPENPVEGNGWIVASWPSALEAAYWADPEVQKRELPRTWPSRMNSEGETWSEVGPDSTFLHLARFIESVRTRKPSVQDARRGHHAAAVPHMVNESIRRQGPVYWDPERDALRA